MTTVREARMRVTSAGLEIDGERFIVLGAELHNSSSSSVSVIDTALARVREIGANTVLAPVSWAQFERVEGEFDTTLIDALIEAADRHDLRVVPLWFGSWKNGMSSYTPDWVKRDTARFPRAHTSQSGAIEHLSPFGRESLSADATALRALLAHIRLVDRSSRVIMVQVQNEVGLLGDSRDRSAVALDRWAEPVPSRVVQAIAESPEMPVHSAWVERGRSIDGTWEQLLGDGPDAHEVFMAWGYATYVDAVARAGAEVNPLPLFGNVWLDSEVELPFDLAEVGLAVAGGMQPGIYPSGGPVARVAPLWAALAPALSFVGPDVYFGDFEEIFRTYRAVFGHLFLPEMRANAVGVSHMFRAIGEHRAIGASPFGVDAIEPGSADEAVLKDGYRLLRAVADILRRTPEATVRGFMLDEATPMSSMEFGSHRAVADTRDPYGFQVPAYPAYGIVIEESPGEILVVGRGFALTFEANGPRKVGILSVTEWDFDREWTAMRELNGDQTGSGSHARLPALGKAARSFFPIPPFEESTAILRVRTYEY